MTDTLTRGLEQLATLNHAPAVDPADQLADIAKTLTVSKRKTADDCPVRLDELQVDPDYQRPPDRDKIAELVKHLKAGGTVDPIRANMRADGSLWITDGQHRAAAAALCSHDTIRAVITAVDQQDEPAETNIMAKVAPELDGEAIGRLLAVGARRDGKRLVLDLGPAGTVAYVPAAAEWVAKSERGLLSVDGPDARRVMDRLGLDELVGKTEITGG